MRICSSSTRACSASAAAEPARSLAALASPMRSSSVLTRAAVASTPGASRAPSVSRAARIAATDAASVRSVSACSADSDLDGESLEAARPDGDLIQCARRLHQFGRASTRSLRPGCGVAPRSSRGGPRRPQACRRCPVAVRPPAGVAPPAGSRRPGPWGSWSRTASTSLRRLASVAAAATRRSDDSVTSPSRKKASSVSFCSPAAGLQQRRELPLREQDRGAEGLLAEPEEPRHGVLDLLGPACRCGRRS